MNSLHHIANFFQQHRWVWLLVYGLMSLWAYVEYFHVITQPDTFCYLLMSEDFLQGRFSEGINSYWGMLISVLIMPFLAIGLDGLVAFKLVQILIGGLALWLFLRMLQRVGLSAMQEILAIVPIFPVLLLAALILTPDLLLLTAGLWYILLVSDPRFFLPLRPLQRGKSNFSNNFPTAWKIGLAGGLMYWSKGYGLPFFVAHFSLLCLIIFVLKWLKPQLPFCAPRQVIKKYAQAILIFGLMSSVWIGAMSYKTGQLTIGTSGKYNIALTGNVMKGVHLTKDELLNPETPYTKYWAYQEAGLFVEDWPPFASPENTQHFIQNIRKNISSLFYTVFIRDVLLLLFIGLCGLLMTYRLSPKIIPSLPPSTFIEKWATTYWIGVFLLAILIYTGGYLLIFIRPRYLLVDYILLWLIFLAIMQIVGRRTGWTTVKVWLALASLIMLINTCDRLGRMTSDRHFFQQVSVINEQLKQIPLKGKSVAANHPSGNLISLDADIYLLYEHRFKYWGQLSDERLKTEGLQKPEQHDIDYFFCWGKPDFESTLFREHELIFRDTLVSLSVYSLSPQSL